MKQRLEEYTNIRNVIAKTILFVIGTVLLLSLFWGYILQGFNLNTSELKEWSRTDSILLIVGFILMVGAAYFNKVIDVMLSSLQKLFGQNGK